jgi:hypothetical protein
VSDQALKSGWSATILWLLGALGLPSALAGVEWRAIQRHPILGVLWVVGSIFCVVMVWWARELWRTSYRDRAVSWTVRDIDRRITRFGGRYRSHLLEYLLRVDLRGLPAGAHTPELDKVYVDVSVEVRAPGRVSPSDLVNLTETIDESDGVGQRQSITDFIALGGNRARVLAVLGAPGSGKTTLLRHTARWLCGRRGPVPILLYLREQASEILADPAISLPILLRGALAKYGLSEPEGWFESRLNRGHCVVMLDGLDEVAGLQDRRAVAEWVSIQAIRYNKNPFLVTSRPLGYREAPVDAATVLRVRRLTRDQIARFVNAWHQAMERLDPEPSSTRASQRARNLIAQLVERPALDDLTANPLLLTMIVMVHHDDHALPARRSELYRQICRVLLWSRDEAKKLAGDMAGDHKEILLRALAYQMTRRKVADLPTADALAIVKNILPRFSETVTGQQFLDDAAASGLFLERENGIRSFAHLTFQEYLTAAHIRDRKLVRILTSVIDDSWWRETTLLYAAEADAGAIIRACLASGSVSALSLAFDCADEATVDPVLRDRLNQLRVEGLAPDAPLERRRLMLAVTLSRYFQPVAHGPAGQRLCARPVTWGIYRLFLDDMARSGRSLRPDLPPNSLESPDDSPVLGVRGSDATAFAGWVNDLISTDAARFRLPHSEELDYFAGSPYAGDGNFIWSLSNGSAPDPWHPAGTARTLRVSTGQLRRHLKIAARPFILMLLNMRITAVTAAFSRAGFPYSPEKVSDLEAERVSEDHLQDLDDAGDAWDRDADRNPILRMLRGQTDKSLEKRFKKALDRADETFSRRWDDLDSDERREREREIEEEALRFAFENNLARPLELVLALGPDFDAALIGESDLPTVRALLHDQLMAEHDDIIHATLRVRDRAVAKDRRIADDLIGSPNRQPSPPDPRDGRLTDALDRAIKPGLQELAGIAMTQALALVRSRTDPASDFTDAICDSAKIAADQTWNPQPETLISALTGAIGKLEAAATTGAPLDRCVKRIIDGLDRHYLPPMRRREPMDAETATAISVAALCLAADAEHRGLRDAADLFRQAAADITWLERRCSGEDPPVEMVILARD